MKITPPSPARSSRRPRTTTPAPEPDPDLPPPPLTMPFALARSLDAGSLAKFYGDHLYGMRVWQVGEQIENGMEILRGVVEGKDLSGRVVDYDSVLVEGVDCYLAGVERGLG